MRGTDRHGLSIRYRERRFLILALAYACFSMGTLYWVLYLAILGMFPQVFYVAEISWLAAYFFYLSLQVLRSEHLSIHFRPAAGTARLSGRCGSCDQQHLRPVTADAGFICCHRWCHRIPVPVSPAAPAALPSDRHGSVSLRRFAGGSICRLFFFSDYTHFNLYFAVDITLTCAFVALLPLTFREVKPS